MVLAFLPQLRYVQGALLLLVVFPTVLVMQESSQAVHVAELCTNNVKLQACASNTTGRVARTLDDIQAIIDAKIENLNGACAVWNGSAWTAPTEQNIEPECIQLVPVSAKAERNTVYTHGHVHLYTDDTLSTPVFAENGETHLTDELRKILPSKLQRGTAEGGVISLLVFSFLAGFATLVHVYIRDTKREIVYSTLRLICIVITTALYIIYVYHDYQNSSKIIEGVYASAPSNTYINSAVFTSFYIVLICIGLYGAEYIVRVVADASSAEERKFSGNICVYHIALALIVFGSFPIIARMTHKNNDDAFYRVCQPGEDCVMQRVSLQGVRVSPNIADTNSYATPDAETVGTPVLYKYDGGDGENDANVCKMAGEEGSQSYNLCMEHSTVADTLDVVFGLNMASLVFVILFAINIHLAPASLSHYAGADEEGSSLTRTFRRVLEGGTAGIVVAQAIIVTVLRDSWFPVANLPKTHLVAGPNATNLYALFAYSWAAAIMFVAGFIVHYGSGSRMVQNLTNSVVASVTGAGSPLDLQNSKLVITGEPVASTFVRSALITDPAKLSNRMRMMQK